MPCSSPPPARQRASPDTEPEPERERERGEDEEKSYCGRLDGEPPLPPSSR